MPNSIASIRPGTRFDPPKAPPPPRGEFSSQRRDPTTAGRGRSRRRAGRKRGARASEREHPAHMDEDDSMHCCDKTRCTDRIDRLTDIHTTHTIRTHETGEDALLGGFSQIHRRKRRNSTVSSRTDVHTYPAKQEEARDDHSQQGRAAAAGAMFCFWLGGQCRSIDLSACRLLLGCCPRRRLHLDGGKLAYPTH